MKHEGKKCVCPREVSRARIITGYFHGFRCSCFERRQMLEFHVTGLSPLDLAHFGLPQPEEEEDGCGQMSPGHKKIHVSPWLLEQIRQSAALKILGFWDSPEGNGIIIPGEHTSPSAISSCPIPRYLRGETNPHLPAPSWNKIITDILFVLRTFRNQRKCHFGCIINNISVYISY